MATKREKPEPAKVCVACGEPVREIGGKPLTAGKTAAYRHVEPPAGCPKGDPLFEGDAR